MTASFGEPSAAPLACECEAGCHNTVAPGSRACWFCIKAGCPLTVTFAQVKDTPWDEVPQRDCHTKGQGLSCGPEHLWATLLNTEYRCTGTRGPYEPGVGAPEAGAAATAPAIKQARARTRRVMSVSEPSEAATIACPPCDDPAGHQYDDDRANLLWGWDGPWAKRGDPCIWCDHSKCAACPPPRGGTFAEEHSAGTEECWSDTCQMEQCRACQTRRATQGASDV